MEAVAISVAQSALSAVVKQATVALTGEIGLQLGVHQELSFIKEELEMMQAFLRAASTQRAKDETVIIWVKQVGELAYEVEHCIQEASLHHKQTNCLFSLFSVNESHLIAKKIQVLKTRIEDVSKRNLRYGLITSINDRGNSLEYEEKKIDRLITNEGAPIVGLEKPIQDVVNLILKEHEQEKKRFRVVSVVGMGGLGKTTLVRKVCGEQEVRSNFPCFAWGSVSHPFNLDEFIWSLCRQLCPHDFEEVEIRGVARQGSKLAVLKRTQTRQEKNEDKLTNYLKDKKCLVVIDVLSNQVEWDEINLLLPIPDENKSCCIVVTTRSESLAKLISHQNDVHIMKPLPKYHSMNLLYSTIFKNASHPREYFPSMKRSNSLSGREEKEPHPQSHHRRIRSSTSFEQKITKEMETQANLIVTKCGRLPLAIVTFCHCLAARPQTSGEWKVMHDRLTFEINNNPQLGKIKAALVASYDGLPYQLKSCFFYLSVFRNHKEIRRSRIIRRWMAEGYLKETRGTTAEEVGEVYFYDLMCRNLIQPSETTTIVNGTVTRCNIHSLIYELIAAKSQDENVMSLLEDQNNLSMNDKVHNLVIAGGWHTKSDVLENMSWSNMRSLTIFGVVDTVVAELPKGIVKLRKLSYLRAGFDLYKSKIVDGRYRTTTREWPMLGTRLCCKEVIDGPGKGKNFGSFGVKAPRMIGKMRSLSNLSMVDIGASKGIANDMKNLIKLKKLGITGLSKRNAASFAEAMKELTKLRTLVLSSADISGLDHCLNSLETLPSSLKYLSSLKLYSPVNKLPNWISKLENLVKMHLRNTNLEIDNIDLIGKLPSLINFCLSKKSVNGNKLCFGQGAFPKLQALVIERMEEVTLISFEESSMPGLGKIEINRCRSLCQGGLTGLEHLVQLKEILFKYKYYEKEEKNVHTKNIEALKKELEKKFVAMKINLVPGL